MRTYIAPIGYNSTTVTRSVLSNGLDSGDHLVLIRPGEETDESRAHEAIADVERLLSEVEPDVSLEVERLPHETPTDATVRCSDVIVGAESDRIVVLGGGARDVLLPITIATALHASLVHRTLLFSDIDGTVTEWDVPAIASQVPVAAAGTLEMIQADGNGHSLSELTEEADVAKSTITRHIEALQRSDAITTWRDGKEKRAKRTATGELLARVAKNDPSPQTE